MPDWRFFGVTPTNATTAYAVRKRRMSPKYASAYTERGRLEEASNDTGTHYLHADRLGSIMAASDSSGTTATWRYSPYGQKLDGLEQEAGFRYTGREAESDNFYYYRARYYDAGVGRFISEDPIGFTGGQANLYAYVGNDPVNLIDPTGFRGQLRKSYLEGQGRALMRYFRMWMEAAGIAATAVAGGPAAGAVRAGAGQICRVGFSKLPTRGQEWYMRHASKVNDAIMGSVSEAGAPPATAAGAGGAAGRVLYDVLGNRDE